MRAHSVQRALVICSDLTHNFTLSFFCFPFWCSALPSPPLRSYAPPSSPLPFYPNPPRPRPPRPPHRKYFPPYFSPSDAKDVTTAPTPSQGLSVGLMLGLVVVLVVAVSIRGYRRWGFSLLHLANSSYFFVTVHLKMHKARHTAILLFWPISILSSQIQTLFQINGFWK